MGKQFKSTTLRGTQNILPLVRPRNRRKGFLRSYKPHALLAIFLIALIAWSDTGILQFISPNEDVYSGSTVSESGLTGYATVIDGDTIRLNGERIRFFGIDAFESKQTCHLSDHSAWPCGQAGTDALRSYVNGATVFCHGDTRDRYGRLVATCEVQSQDLGEWMVLQGLALAYRKYSSRYIHAENSARDNKAGVHRGTYTLPWVYRRKGA